MKNNLTNDARLEAVQARLALRLTAALSERAADCDADISERLRHAREQALARAREARKAAPQTSSAVQWAGETSLSLTGPSSDEGRRWWARLATILPLLVLLGGLALIQHWHSRDQISTAADIDMSLLADDVPPDAYSDPGFLEFLKTPKD